MSEPRIVNIIEFLDRSSRVINQKTRLRMTALQFGIRHSTNKLCMPVIPFPSERVFNSATFMFRHIVLATVRNFLNLHLKNCSG